MSHADSKSSNGEAPCAAAEDAQQPSPEATAPETVQAVKAHAAEPSSGSSSASGSSPPAEHTIISHSPPFPSPSSSSSAAPALGGGLVGQKLDHFELLDVVGGGGMGIVFRALDTALNRTVALKILSLDRSADEDTVRRFRNEAQSAARLDHENIARVYYVGEDRGLNYIVFEYIEGVNLRDLVAEEGPPPVEQVLSVGVQLAHALEHASARNVVHRDIKPSNVLMAADGRAKLVDMGLSRLAEPDSNDDLTSSGVTLGTFDYISPEQARDPRNADVRSDIYSLGCTLYFMLTGQPPFPGGNAMQKLLQHQGDAAPDPRVLNPVVPDELARVVRKMLAKDPRRRYQNPRSLLVDLSLLVTQLGIDLSGAGVTLLLPGQSLAARLARRHLPWLVPLAAMIVIAFALDRSWGGRNAGSALPASLQFPHIGSLGKSPPAGKAKGRASKKKVEEPGPGGAAARSPTPPEARKTVDPEVLAGADNPRNRLLQKVAGADSDLTTGRSGIGPGDVPAGGLKIAEGGAAATTDDGDSTGRLVPGDVEEPTPKVGPITTMERNRFIVTPDAQPGEENTFRTIKAALKRAKSGATIELHYSGPVVQPPFRLALDSVTIRAGKDDDGNEYRPVVRFTPDSPDATAYPRSMIELRNTRLKLINVAFDLRSPLSATGDWAMFGLDRSNVDLKRCTLTIVNLDEQGTKYDEEVSFFKIRTGTPAGAMMMKTGMALPTLDPIQVTLENCVARGEAIFFHTGHSRYPIRLNWTNGLLTTTEQLFMSLGVRTAPKSGEHEIRLNHLTALTRGGLCAFRGEPEYPHHLPADLECNDSILRGSPGAPLIHQEATGMVMQLKDRLTWRGDKNFYEGFQTYWRVMDVSLADSPLEMMQRDWKKHWDSREMPVPRIAGQTFGWEGLPEEGEPVHQHVPADYALKPTSQASGQANDGSDVGCDMATLPTPPLSRLVVTP